MADSVNELFKKYRATHDVSLRNAIAEKHLYIAEILAKRFVGRGVAYEDLLQEASMYLLEAVETFDETRGLQFSTYATPTIAGKLKNYFRDKARLVKVPRRFSEVNLEIRRFAEDYLSRYGKTPSIKEIAVALSYQEEEIVQALEAGKTVSLDAQVGDDGGRTLGDTLPMEEDGFARFELKETLAAATAGLSDLEKALVECRFVEELSQTETAERLDVSQMTVSRMERKILAKLRARLQG